MKRPVSERAPRATPTRRIVVTVCPRESGVVSLPVDRGRRPERMDAATLTRHLEALVERRQLSAHVRVQAACAGGCAGDGPNVSVAIFTIPPPGKAPDNIAVGWRTYVTSLDTPDCLARVLEDNLTS
jgi:hypothetical protein